MARQSLVTGLALTMGVLPLSVHGGLCAACRERVFTTDVGRCSACAAGTASGAFKLCRDCSGKLGQCEACRTPLAKTAAGTVVPRAVEVGEGTTGRNFELVSGQELVVHLTGNPTTGYNWVLAQTDTNVLVPVGDIEFVRTKNPSPRLGQGGTFVARFTAGSAGETPVVFEYRRPWEKDQPAAKRFAVTVRVRAGGKTGP